MYVRSHHFFQEEENHWMPFVAPGSRLADKDAVCGSSVLGPERVPYCTGI
jgi:hypothetical protein